MRIQLTRTIVVAGFTLAASTFFTAVASPLSERIAADEPIRIGFANVPIFGYPDENGDAKGFVNEITLAILKQMGHENVETIVTDWGGLIPGLQANRYDLITGGLYILNSRCENIAFSEPIGSMGDAFLVPVGNPKGLNTYQDILDADALLVTGAGYNTVEAAKKEGLTDAQIMQVPGPSEMRAAVGAGRADAAGLTYFEAKHLAEESEGAMEVTDPAALPEWTKNWVGIGFRSDDADFIAEFNAALTNYVGSDDMMAAVEEYGYLPSHLPDEKTTEWICANR